MSQLKELYYSNVVSLIENDKEFFEFKNSESLKEKLGFPTDHYQSMVIKIGLKLEKAATYAVMQYANKNSINLERRDPFITKALRKNNHKGEQQIDYHFYRNCDGVKVIWVSEIKTNPNLDKGKTESVISSLEQAYNTSKLQNNDAIIKLSYTSIIYSPKSEQTLKPLRIQKILKEKGINCNIYPINNLMTDTLGISKSEFSDLELMSSIKDLGSYLIKELANV